MEHTSIDELRAQLKPESVEITGFRPGQKIRVLLKRIDYTLPMLKTGLSNPIQAAIVEMVKTGNPGKAVGKFEKSLDREGKKVGVDFSLARPMLEEYAKAALLKPSWADLQALKRELLEGTGISEDALREEVEHPLNASQLTEIYNWVLNTLGELREVASFRR